MDNQIECTQYNELTFARSCDLLGSRSFFSPNIIPESSESFMFGCNELTAKNIKISVSDRNWIIPWRRSRRVGISVWDASTPEEKEQVSKYYFSYFQGFLPRFQGFLSTEMVTPGTTPRILKLDLCFNYEFSNYLNRFSTPKRNANNLPS